MIKNINNLKNIQIVCRNKQDIENCLNMLEELGFEVRNNDNQYKVIFYREYSGMFENDIRLECEKETYFFNKKFIKILKKLINEKEEKKKEKQEKIEDIEVAEDERIIKINNYKSEKEIIVACDWENIENGIKISDVAQIYLDFCLKYGLAYATAEARDKAMFKLEIEKKLKNIAERLNNGRKIDWEDIEQPKYEINYDYRYKKLDYGVNCNRKFQGIIYCLDSNFLDVAKKEIGEQNLIKYFKES